MSGICKQVSAHFSRSGVVAEVGSTGQQPPDALGLDN